MNNKINYKHGGSYDGSKNRCFELDEIGLWEQPKPILGMGVVTNLIMSNHEISKPIYEAYIKQYESRIESINKFCHNSLVRMWGENYMERFNSGELIPTTHGLTLLMPLLVMHLVQELRDEIQRPK